jgi:hypothetical protein
MRGTKIGPQSQQGEGEGTVPNSSLSIVPRDVFLSEVSEKIVNSVQRRLKPSNLCPAAEVREAVPSRLRGLSGPGFRHHVLQHRPRRHSVSDAFHPIGLVVVLGHDRSLPTPCDFDTTEAQALRVVTFAVRLSKRGFGIPKSGTKVLITDVTIHRSRLACFEALGRSALRCTLAVREPALSHA